jgi:hypothetical protein
MTLKCFTIENNKFLNTNIQAWFRCDYVRYGNPGNPDYLNILKNDFNSESYEDLKNALDKLEENLINELKTILSSSFGNTTVAISIIPRAKKRSFYQEGQILFYRMIKYAVEMLRYEGLAVINGMDYIVRHTDTRTTHFKKPGYGGDGNLPYPGITRDTCTISDAVRNKNILLIDDIYTKTVNIDEDAIQALLDNGAKKVVFFAIARTVHHSANQQY